LSDLSGTFCIAYAYYSTVIFKSYYVYVPLRILSVLWRVQSLLTRCEVQYRTVVYEKTYVVHPIHRRFLSIVRRNSMIWTTKIINLIRRTRVFVIAFESRWQRVVIDYFRNVQMWHKNGLISRPTFIVIINCITYSKMCRKFRERIVNASEYICSHAGRIFNLIESVCVKM